MHIYIWITTAPFTKAVIWLNIIITGNVPIPQDPFNPPVHSIHKCIFFSPYPFIPSWNSHRRHSSPIVLLLSSCRKAGTGASLREYSKGHRVRRNWLLLLFPSPLRNCSTPHHWEIHLPRLLLPNATKTHQDRAQGSGRLRSHSNQTDVEKERKYLQKDLGRVKTFLFLLLI